jgi:signal transduction histidine kinase
LNLAGFGESSKMSAVLKERNRIAREIHDVLARSLTAILLQADLAEEVLCQNQQEALRHINRVRGLVREGLVDVRRSVFALRAQALENQSLATALQLLVAERTSDTGIRHEFLLHGSVPVIPHAVEAELLRVAQEALTNVQKHARATKLRIELTSNTRCLALSIQDDGAGCDLSAALSSQSFGLLGMQERASKIGGQLVLQSQPGCGTLIQITVPLEKKQVLAQNLVC